MKKKKKKTLEKTELIPHEISWKIPPFPHFEFTLNTQRNVE